MKLTDRSKTCESRRILLIMCFRDELQLWAASACCFQTHNFQFSTEFMFIQ